MNRLLFGDEDYFEKVDTELANTVEWIIPNAQKNMMEPIRLTLKPGGSTYPDLPHEGRGIWLCTSGKYTDSYREKSLSRKKRGVLLFYSSFRALH